MDYVWNLDTIYKGFDDPAFSGDLERMSTAVSEMEVLTGELETQAPAQVLRRGLELQEQLFRLTHDLAGFAALRQSVDATDSEAGSKMGQIMAIYSGVAAPTAAFAQWVAKQPDLDSLITSDPFFEEYRFVLENMKQSSGYLLSGQAETVMAKMQMSGGNAWAELQQYLTSTVPVTFRGETINFPAVRAKAYDSDPQVRRDAYEAELASCASIKDPVAYALNSIKLETITDCQLRGYESPLDRTLKQDHVKRETLDAMLGAIDEYLPKFRQYLKAKGKALGHENGLPWYDLFAPLGSSSTKFTPETTRDYLVELFSHFDSQLAEMVSRAFAEGWIDFFPRAGKSGGAFCEGVGDMSCSRIMTNYTGSFSDNVVLAHELGHAFHNLCISGHRPLNWDYSMPVAETASTFNECIIMNKAIRDAADDAEKLYLLENQLRDVTQIMVDIYSRYLFEAAVFERRESEFMSADTFCQMMLEAQKKTYGDGLDESTLHPYMWLVKSHYYGPTFYNFPYAFGGLFARGLYARYDQLGEAFVPQYKELLRTTPVATAEDAAMVAGIDLTDKNFWRSALQIVSDKIDLFCQLAEQ